MEKPRKVFFTVDRDNHISCKLVFQCDLIYWILIFSIITLYSVIHILAKSADGLQYYCKIDIPGSACFVYLLIQERGPVGLKLNLQKLTHPYKKVLWGPVWLAGSCDTIATNSV